MHLSISNFDSKLSISLVLTLFIIIAYSFFLKIFQPNITVFQNQWVSNYSVAEGYIYKKYPPQLVIVGSSMSARLLEDKFDSDLYNLSFSGGSAITGLSIIKKSEIIPQKIYIETNLLERKIDHEMVDSLFTPIIWQIKYKLLPLQYKYQPMNLFLTFTKEYFGRNKEAKINAILNGKSFQMALQILIEKSKQTKYLENNNDIGTLKDLVYFFRKKGVEIVFFQMPVAKEILLSKQYSLRKKILLEMFPETKFYWVKVNEIDEYQTSDGIHLISASAIKYSSELNRYFSQ